MELNINLFQNVIGLEHSNLKKIIIFRLVKLFKQIIFQLKKSFLAIFSLLLLPFADHSFALKAISSLFVLK